MARQPTGAPAASSSTSPADPGGPVLVRRAHHAAAHDHAVGQVGHRAGLRARRDPEADRHRQVGGGAGALHQRRQLGSSSPRSPGGAGERHGVDESARVRADRLQPLGRGRGRHERHQRQSLGVAGRAQLGALVVGQVGHDQAAAPAAARALGVASPPRAARRWRRPSAPPAAAGDASAQSRSTSSGVTPAASARVAAAWITGPSASGSENGTPSSIRSAPASAAAAQHACDGLRRRGTRPSGTASARRARRAGEGRRHARSALTGPGPRRGPCRRGRRARARPARRRRGWPSATRARARARAPG